MFVQLKADFSAQGEMNQMAILPINNTDGTQKRFSLISFFPQHFCELN